MKKKSIIILAMLILVLGTLVGCDSVIPMIPTNSQESQESQEPQEPQESQEPQEGQVYEDEYIKVTYIEIFEENKLQKTCHLKLNVENKSDGKITVTAMSGYINDVPIVMTFLYPMILDVGEEAQDSLYMTYSMIGLESMDEIEKIETQFTIISENFTGIKETKTITFNI